MEGVELMRVLVTGSEGYIGTVLCAYLLDRGHDVTGLDTGFHRVGWLYHGVDRSPAWLAKDIRHITVDDLRGFDAVVHLAELSNDPVGQLNPDITFEINHLAAFVWRPWPARQASSASSTCRPAASTAPLATRTARRPLTSTR